MSFLTGFALGFAKRATKEIDIRNAELRKNMDTQIEKHRKEYQQEYEEKRELRKQYKERSTMLDAELAAISEIAGPMDLTYGQKLVLIKDDKTLMQFRQDLNDINNMDSAEGKRLQLQAIQKRISGKDNIKYNNIDEAIEAATRLDALVDPVVVSQKTAFGIPSKLQARLLEDYKASTPGAFKERKSRDIIAGSYEKRPGTVNITESQARVAVGDIVETNIKNRITGLGTGGLQVVRPLGQLPSVVGAQDKKIKQAIQAAYDESINNILNTYMNRDDGTIPASIARSMANQGLGIDFKGRLAKGNDRVYVGDILPSKKTEVPSKNLSDADEPLIGGQAGSGVRASSKNQKYLQWNAENRNEGYKILDLGEKLNALDPNNPNRNVEAKQIFKEIKKIYPEINTLSDLRKFLEVVKP